VSRNENTSTAEHLQLSDLDVRSGPADWAPVLYLEIRCPHPRQEPAG